MAEKDRKLPWIRHSNDWLTNPKWKTIAKLADCKVGDVTNVVSYIELQGNNGIKNGYLVDWSSEDVASLFDMEISKVEKIIEMMQNRFLVGDKIIDWDKRHPKREDEKNNERQKRFKDSKKIAELEEKLRLVLEKVTPNNAEVTPDNTESHQITPNNAEVTPSHTESHQKTLEERREEEIKEKDKTKVLSKKKIKKLEKEKFLFPFSKEPEAPPDPELLEWAMKEFGVDEQTVTDFWNRWRSYWTLEGGAGQAQFDWHGIWRNDCKKFIKPQQKGYFSHANRNTNSVPVSPGKSKYATAAETLAANYLAGDDNNSAFTPGHG